MKVLLTDIQHFNGEKIQLAEGKQLSLSTDGPVVKIFSVDTAVAIQPTKLLRVVNLDAGHVLFVED